MYLYSLTVENYRALRSAQVVLDATSVLIGENDRGKSSLLEALATAPGAMAPKVRSPPSRPGGLISAADQADVRAAGLMTLGGVAVVEMDVPGVVGVGRVARR